MEYVFLHSQTPTAASSNVSDTVVTEEDGENVEDPEVSVN